MCTLFMPGCRQRVSIRGLQFSRRPSCGGAPESRSLVFAVLHLLRRHGAYGVDSDALIKMAYDVANAMEGAIGNHSVGD